MKKVLVLSLALILLLGITSHGTSSYFSDTETSAGNTFTAWVDECVCEKFNVSDVKDAKIYKYDDSGSFVGSFDLSVDNGFPVGVAAVGGYVYVVDHADKQVYRYSCCGGTPVVSRTLLKADGNSSVGNIDGLAIDIIAGEMWMLSGNKKNIYQYSLLEAFPDDGSSLKAAREIGLDNTGAVGLAIDSTYLYVLDYDTSGPVKETRFYRYDRSTGVCGIGDISKVLLDGGGIALQSPAGAMFYGTSLWVVDSGTNKVYRYDNVASLFPGDSNTVDADWEFALDGANDDASGM